MCSDIIKALDVLIEYPDLQEYIKDFDCQGGFMFTKETDDKRIDCQARLDALLDPNGRHSGGSWGCLMRGIQAVLNGVFTREQLLARAAEEEEHMNLMLAKNAELRKTRLQAEAEE
jgi:hypothetical protein